MRICKWSVRLLVVLGLLAGASAGRTLANDSCFSCQSRCQSNSIACHDRADAAYDSCLQADVVPDFECFSRWSQAVASCSNAFNSCWGSCSGICSAPPPINPDDNPTDEPDHPIDFGPKGTNEASRAGSIVKSPAVPEETSTVELRLSLEAYEAMGGLDVPLPKGVSSVGVEVRFDPRPSDLLGTLVKFAGAGSRSNGEVRYRLASPTALPPFEAGRYRVAGDTLRVEPVLSAAQTGDGLVIRVTLFR